MADHQAAALVGRMSRESTDPSARVTARETHQAVLDAMDELDDDHRSVIVELPEIHSIRGLKKQKIIILMTDVLYNLQDHLHLSLAL